MRKCTDPDRIRLNISLPQHRALITTPVKEMTKANYLICHQYLGVPELRDGTSYFWTEKHFGSELTDNHYVCSLSKPMEAAYFQSILNFISP